MGALTVCPTAAALREGWRTSSRSERYEVHWDGRVRNAKTQRVLKPSQSKSGHYAKVCLGRTLQIQVHQLVCETWHGPKPVGMPHVVDHIDNSPRRNVATNLRWATYSMNTRNWYAMQARFVAAGLSAGHHELQELEQHEIDSLYDRLEGAF